MITGNITLSSRPQANELQKGVICSACGKECKEIAIDLSFSDAFGIVRTWGKGSNCCEAECMKTQPEEM